MIRTLLFMATEAIWLLAPLVLLAAALPSGEPVEAAVLLYPLGYAAARLVPIRDDRVWVEVAWCVGLFVAATLAAAVAAWAFGGPGEHRVPSFVFASMIGALAWTRGWILARREAGPTVFALSFQFGLVVVGGTLFFASDLGVPVWTQLALAVSLIVFGPGGLWTARSATKGWHGGSGNPGTALIGLVAVFGIGALLWALFDRTALEAAWAAVDWTVRQIGRLIVYLLSLLPEVAPPTPVDMQPSTGLGLSPEPERPPAPAEPPALLARGVLVAILGLVGACAALGLYQFFKALARAKRSGRTQGLAYGRAEGSLFDRLRAFLRAVALRLRRAFDQRLERWREARREGSIRGRYRRLLGRLARRGWPRRADETPQEYQRRLAPQWPDSAPHFAALTQAFVAARYGGREPDPAIVEELWRRLRPCVGKLRRPND